MCRGSSPCFGGMGKRRQRRKRARINLIVPPASLLGSTLISNQSMSVCLSPGLAGRRREVWKRKIEAHSRAPLPLPRSPQPAVVMVAEKPAPLRAKTVRLPGTQNARHSDFPLQLRHGVGVGDDARSCVVDQVAAVGLGKSILQDEREKGDIAVAAFGG